MIYYDQDKKSISFYFQQIQEPQQITTTLMIPYKREHNTNPVGLMNGK